MTDDSSKPPVPGLVCALLWWVKSGCFCDVFSAVSQSNRGVFLWSVSRYVFDSVSFQLIFEGSGAEIVLSFLCGGGGGGWGCPHWRWSAGRRSRCGRRGRGRAG